MLPRDKVKFPKVMVGIRELGHHTSTPKQVIAAVANRLVADLYPRLPKLAGTPRAMIDARPVRVFAEWLAGMDAAHIGFWLSSAYAHLVDEDQRRNQAMFFTPPALGIRILDRLDTAGLDCATAHIIDIACGGAAFLAPAGRRMAEALTAKGVGAKAVLAHIGTRLTGIEIDGFLARLSRLFIGITLYPWIEEAGELPEVRVLVGDALRRSWSLVGRFDAVICNPPYRKLAREEVARLPTQLRELCHFQPNLYAMFMVLSAQLLNANGVAGLLTPMSFLSGRSFMHLRRRLAETNHVRAIDLVEAKHGVFLGVEQDTAITVLGPKVPRRTDTEVCIGHSAAQWPRAGNVMLDVTGGPWILPRTSDDAKLIAAANGRTLQDYGYASAVGNVVLYRDPRRRFATLQAARDAKAVHPVPMLQATEVQRNGRLAFQRTPRSNSFIDAGASCQGLVRGRAVVLQRVTSPEQSRRLICAPVPAAMQHRYNGVIGENHVTFLVAGPTAKVSPTLLAQILCSEAVDRLFRCRSGANNVSTYELAHLPLPDPEIVRTQLAAGVGIDAAVRAGFGITSAAGREKKKP